MTSTMGSVAMGFTEEQGMLRDVARQFVRDRAPIEAVREQLESPLGYDPALWQEMVDLGWSGMARPEACGGAGLGIAAVIPVLEALGHGLLGTPLLNTTLAGQLLLRLGTSAEPWLERIAGGEVMTVAFLDGNDWGADNTGVILNADGTLTGVKQQVGDAQSAAFFVVVGQQNGVPAIAVVERGALTDDAIAANTLIDLTKRSANVDFSGAKVSWSASGDAVVAALRDFQLIGALLVAAEATGTVHRCLETLNEYLKTRTQFGKPIGSYQALKHPMVDMYCGLEDCRSFIYHAAVVATDGALDTDAEIACRMAKAKAADVIEFAGDRSIQFHGGFGFTWDCDSTLFIRRAQWSRQCFGDAGQHRKRLAQLMFD